MASPWRSTVLATAIMAVPAMGFAIGAIPVQTVGGFGESFSPVPTEAPSMDLLKGKLFKKAVTNVCTEWTIPGGGQPQCSNSETCLFKTATDGFFYEGCGQTSIVYDWVTECFNYPQSGTPPVSEIYCPKSAPYCGYYGFVFAPGYTFFNFGCSTTSYGVRVELLATTSGSASSATRSGSTTASTTDSVSSATDSTTTRSSASARSTSTSTLTSPTSSTSTVGLSGASSSSTANATIGSHKASAPIGAIVGGVVGGLAVIAFLIAFLVWFCVRKRKEKKAAQIAQGQQQQADAASAAAFHNNQHVAEIGGTNVKPFIGAYAPNGQEKPGPVIGAAEVQGSNQPVQQTYGENLHANGPSPPPVYAQPGPSPMQSPHQNYNELATPVSGTDRPVSPMGTVTSQSPPPQMYGQFQQQQNQPGELAGNNRQSSPPPQQNYQPYPPPGPQPQQYQPQPTELAGENRHSSPPPPQQQAYAAYHPPAPQAQPTELGGENRGSWQTPPGVQEMGSGPGPETRMPQPPPGPPPGAVGQHQEPVAEMSATVGNRVTRRPVGSSPGQQVDMSGAPMNENWNGHHELE